MSLFDRRITNAIRFVLDECVPPIIRDSRVFMYPVFLVWCGFSHAKAVALMDFKRREYLGIRPADSLGPSAPATPRFSLYHRRKTDLNAPCIALMRASLDARSKTLLDVGAGKGHWAKIASLDGLSVTACDTTNAMAYPDISFVKANVLALPFPDHSFDTVTCTHTLEHILELRLAVAELIRVARLQLVIVVPCQRENYYTPDGHIHFFPFHEKLLHALGLPKAVCHKRGGDWVVLADLSVRIPV